MHDGKDLSTIRTKFFNKPEFTFRPHERHERNGVFAGKMTEQLIDLELVSFVRRIGQPGC
jgi:hypothetical protein